MYKNFRLLKKTIAFTLSLLIVAIGFQTSFAQDDLPELEIDEAKMPKIYKHIKDAIADGKPCILTRETDKAKIKENRKKATDGFTPPNDTDTSPDEYPFASTKEGGEGASVKGVPLKEQRVQGGVLSAFYRKHKIKDGDKFKIKLKPKPAREQVDREQVERQLSSLIYKQNKAIRDWENNYKRQVDQWENYHKAVRNGLATPGQGLYNGTHSASEGQVSLTSGDTYPEFETGDEKFVTNDSGVAVSVKNDADVEITVYKENPGLEGFICLTTTTIKVKDNKLKVGNEISGDTAEIPYTPSLTATPTRTQIESKEIPIETGNPITVKVWVNNADPNEVTEVVFVIECD